MTVQELLGRITSSEITEWLAYFSLEANPPKKQQTPEEARAVLRAMSKRKRK